MVRGTEAVSYTYLATVYTILGIRACPTRPTRPEGAPGLVPRPAQARLFVRPVGSTDLSLISFIQEIIVGRYFEDRRCERSITLTSLPLGSCNQCHSVMTTNTRTSKPLRQNPEGPVAKVRYLLLLNIYSGS